MHVDRGIAYTPENVVERCPGCSAVAPEALDLHVRETMDEVIRERGFLGYSSHVAQIGRAKFVEIHILVSPDLRIETVKTVDALRREIAARLDAAWPETRLTVDLTADPAWM